MLNQYFKPLLESAQEITKNSNNDFLVHQAEESIQAPSFEAQLEKGLFVAISQLHSNRIGWSYRKSPVMIYGISQNSNAVHLSSHCKTLKQNNQWVWVSTDKNQAQQAGLVWCEDCLKQLNYQQYNQADIELKNTIKENFSFLEFVQLHVHEYFNSPKLKLWQPGQSLIALPESDEEEDDSIHSCQLCTWQLPSQSHYLMTGQQGEDFGCDQSHCILCMGEQLNSALIIPPPLRWQALQARFKYFNGVCDNWAQLRFHIDKSWHPLVDVMRQQGIARPGLYESITCEGYMTMVAPLVWKDRKRAILPDDFNKNIQLPNDWDFWSYSQVLTSFKAS